MSYWGRPGGSSPAWASRGPSPVVPLLIVIALGWVICNETLTGWYDELQESVTSNAGLLVLGAGMLVLALAVVGNRSEVVLVPVALVVVFFLLQNIMVAALLLLVAAYLAGIYYYRPDRGYSYGGGGGDWGAASGGCCTGLGFYMLMVLCLVLCAMFAKDDGSSWWVPGVLLVLCLLCLNLFSGGKVWGYEYF